VRRADPDPESVEQTATLLEQAERPIILAGNGAVRIRSRGVANRDSESANQLRDLVSQMGLPVVATYMGKGAISDREPHSLLTLDSGPDGEAGDAISRADCVLAVGYDIAEHDPEGWNPDLDTTIIHIDHEPAEVYRHYNPEVEIVADIPASLQAISERVRPGSGKTWCTEVHDRIIEEVSRRPDADDSVTVRRTLPILREVMADEDILISDVGSHKMAIAQNFPTYEPNTCIISNGLASMGIAVPGGLAADLACESNVVAATGDGGFLMNAAEIETATRLGLGYTILLFNDDDYGLISEQQIEHTGGQFGTELSNPDFVTLAESFGISGYRPETWDELEGVLNEVVPSKEMALVEVRLE
jgi:acetolactate synthase-1/2/3 large subunit